MKENREGVWRVFCYALILGLGVLFFCSKSSIAYPINDWSDANIYFSAGKGMLSGRVMYRDLYDHKGPLLYALHALCALLFPGDFTGVYLLEALFAAAFLTIAHRLIVLYGGGRAAWLALPVIALLVYSSFSFQAGDSAEELALPMILFGLYDLMVYIKRDGPGPMAGRRLLLQGFLLGCVFWMKFTLCGAQGAVVCVALAVHGSRHGSKAVFRCLGWLLLGFFLSTLPWLCYFGIHHAILDWAKAYLYDNLFLYSQEEGMSLLGRGKNMVKSALDWVASNPLWALPTLAGVGYALFGKNIGKWERLAWGLAFAFCGLGVLITGKTYPYYMLALAAFLPVFFVPIGQRLAPVLKKGSGRVAGLTALSCVACIGLCAVLSPNVAESFGQKREETMQYQFAAIINETPAATLLNYGFMDAGFYTAARVVPTVKYYHQTNVPLPEMLEEQERYIEEGICDYVVTRGRQPEAIDEGYDLIAVADSPEGFWYDHVYLYRLKNLE